MKPILLISILFLLIAPGFSWAGGNQVNHTLTVNTGMGVNNGTNKTLSTSDNNGTACAGGSNGSCNGGPFADTSDPFNVNDDCSSSSFGNYCSSQFDPGLPGGFNLIDNRFGRGAPCGPNDHSGPPFPYPCQTKGSVHQIIPLGIDDTTSSKAITLSPPSLAPVGPNGQVFYDFHSDTFGNLRVHHIEYGFDQNEDSEQTLKIFFVIDSTADANGQMVGNAVGTFQMRLSESHPSNCSATSSKVSSQGRFESGPTGVITCVDNGGNLCQGSQFNPGQFAATSFTCPP